MTELAVHASRRERAPPDVGRSAPLDLLDVRRGEAQGVRPERRVVDVLVVRVVRVLRAGQKFELLAHNDMGEGIVASPAISDGQIFIRGEKHLFCIDTR